MLLKPDLDGKMALGNLDAIGVSKGIELMKAEGKEPAPWVLRCWNRE